MVEEKKNGWYKQRQQFCMIYYLYKDGKYDFELWYNCWTGTINAKRFIKREDSDWRGDWVFILKDKDGRPENAQYDEILSPMLKIAKKEAKWDAPLYGYFKTADSLFYYMNNEVRNQIDYKDGIFSGWQYNCDVKESISQEEMKRIWCEKRSNAEWL